MPTSFRHFLLYKFWGKSNGGGETPPLLIIEGGFFLHKGNLLSFQFWKHFQNAVLEKIPDGSRLILPWRNLFFSFMLFM